MKFSNVLATAGEWLRGEGPHHQVVISSRVRLAREKLRQRIEDDPELMDVLRGEA